MQESASVTSSIPLTVGQLRLIARKYGAFSGRTLVDVGCGTGEWILSQRQKGHKISGMEEKSDGVSPAVEGITIGSPAAAVPWESHSIDTILLRGTSVLEQAAFQPERMIALANLGSSLKARGKLLIPLSGNSTEEIEQAAIQWREQLSTFPGQVRIRSLKTGLSAYLTLAFLFGGVHQVTLLEFQVNRKLVSRLEWHRLARSAVMSHLNSPAAA